MSNRVDFYQSKREELSIAAGRSEVFYEGSLCSELEVKEIVRAGAPEFGWAKFTGKPGIGFKAQAGARICVKYLYDKGTSPEDLVIFTGRVEKIEKKLEANKELTEITARDFSSELERITVYGRYFTQSDGSILFIDSIDTIFNEQAEANGSKQTVLHKAREVRLFSAGTGESRNFNCAEVIDYLLSMYLPIGVLGLQPVERLKALTGGLKANDLDLTGMSLLDALRRCCEQAGIGFRFTARQSETGPREAILFYKEGIGGGVELNCQRQGEELNVSATNIEVLKSTKVQPVTNLYTGRGDFKRFEATFELVKGWDTSLEEYNYDLYSPSTNPDFIKVKDVWRRWVLNEGGDYSGEPFNQDDAYDFTNVFENSNFVRKVRRFLPALSCDRQGKSLGYYLEISLDGGGSWRQYLGAFDNRLDECGIWLSSDKLDIDTYIAGLKGTLRFRLTATVVSDERLSFAMSDGPVDSVVPVVERIFTLPRRFAYRKVTGKSIFANSNREGLGEADEADDSNSLREYVRRQIQAADRAEESFEVKTLYLQPNYQAGDIVIMSPESRDLFGIKNNTRKTACIERVRMDFACQCTELKIVKSRRSIL